LTLAPLHILFFIQPIRFPKRSFVERVWQREQALAEEIKKEPGGKQPKHQLGGAQRPRKRLPLLQPGGCDFSKAVSTDDAIFMLGNTFPAKKVSAGRAAGGGFPQGMIKTALFSETWHQTIRGGVFGSSTGDVVGFRDPDAGMVSTADPCRTRVEISSGVRTP